MIVIEGIGDLSIKANIRAARCSTFAEVAEYVANFPCSSHFNKPSRNKVNDLKGDTFKVEYNKDRKNAKHVICFGCTRT